MNLYGHKVNQLARNFIKRLNEKIAPLGLYSSQWGIILCLYDKEQCTQIEISQYLGVEAPTITRTLTKMEKLGLVTRSYGKDKREKIITLTEKSYKMFPKWFEEAKKMEVDAIDNIKKEELDIFSNVLEKIMNNLD